MEFLEFVGWAIAAVVIAIVVVVIIETLQIKPKKKIDPRYAAHHKRNKELKAEAEIKVKAKRKHFKRELARSNKYDPGARKRNKHQTRAQAPKSYAAPRICNEWEEVFIPKHRPRGKWVNWQYGSGWVKIVGTKHRFDEVKKVIDFLGTFIPDNDTIEVELIRTLENPHDINAIEVWAFCQPAGGKSECYQLGFIEREAAKWLAETYDEEMPIAAELKKFAGNGEAASITIAALMPPKKKREQYRLG